MLEGEGPSTAPIPQRSGTTLAPEQAQRLAVKLGKRFPILLDGLEEHEKAMLVSPTNWSFRNSPGSGNFMMTPQSMTGPMGLSAPSPTTPYGPNAGGGGSFLLF